MTIRLPIDDALLPLRQAWTEKSSIILKAAPGSGKTTRVPAFLGRSSEKRIVVLEPRRLAARLSAQFVSSEHNSPVGDFCGYQIRFEKRFGAGTKVLFVTEGVFLNMLISDPTLAQVGTVIIDEFHERHINTDIALSVTRKLQATVRKDLKLVVMSATIDTAHLESFLPDAAVFDVPGTTYPVQVSYHPGATERPSPEHMAALAVKMANDPTCPGNILVFATGAKEIRDIVSSLHGSAVKATHDIFALSAETGREDQGRIFAQGGRRRIVVSTNVAETSLTISGITGVVDNGQAKISGYAEWSGMATLDIRKISKASCIQRTGRAGRTAAGVCYRAFSEADFHGRPDFTVPEINRSDLSELIVSLATIGVLSQCDSSHVVSDLPWLEHPNLDHLNAAVSYLELIGALEEGRLTAFGRRVAQLPIPPRLAALYVRGQDRNIGDLAAAAVAVLGEGGIHRYGSQPPVAHDSDLEFQSECLLRLLSGERLPHAESIYIDQGKAQAASRVWSQLAGQKRPVGSKVGSDDAKHLRMATIAAYPDRIGQRKQTAQRQIAYGFSSGGGGLLSRSSVVSDSELIVALEGVLSHARSGDVGVTIELASGIERSDLSAAPSELFRTESSVRWSDKARRVEVTESAAYGAITLEAKGRHPVGANEKSQASQLLAQWIKNNWDDFVAADGFLAQYLLRTKLINEYDASGFPLLEGDMRELFVEVICEGRWSLDSLSGGQLKSLIYEQLSWDDVQKLERLTPEDIVLSGQRRFPVTYRDGAPPIIRGFIQDFYGNPGDVTVAEGKVVVSVELLGPNKRPIQITASLKNFWGGTYQQLKPELSRNYPKHHWPEKPESAPPVLLKSRLNKNAVGDKI